MLNIKLSGYEMKLQMRNRSEEPILPGLGDFFPFQLKQMFLTGSGWY